MTVAATWRGFGRAGEQGARGGGTWTSPSSAVSPIFGYLYLQGCYFLLEQEEKSLAPKAQQ